MAPKPVLRGEAGARALAVQSGLRWHGQVRLCNALGCGACVYLKPIKARGVVEHTARAACLLLVPGLPPGMQNGTRTRTNTIPYGTKANAAG